MISARSGRRAAEGSGRGGAGRGALAEKASEEGAAGPGAGASREGSRAWQGEAPVLCVAGRGPLDEAASSMLAQLLREAWVGRSRAPYQAVARQNIIRLDVSGVAMI